MKKLHKNPLAKIVALLSLAITATFFAGIVPASAHISPPGCAGSGLGISMFADVNEIAIGDPISYTIVVFNGTGFGPVACSATGIQASLITPDGTSHPITLLRTSLSNGQFDVYSNVVTYTARAQDMVGGILAATASDTGVIHQNVADSQGGANQGLNVVVLNSLHVIKTVINDSGGGSLSAADFSVHVEDGGSDVSGSPMPGAGAPGTLYTLGAGTYAITEPANTSYVQSFSGDCDASGSITLTAGQDKTCTITNNDIAPATISVVKVVVNNDTGTRVVSDFPLFVDATSVLSGAVTVFPAPASYIVTETANPNYTQVISGDCDATGHVSIVPGDHKVCTITNDDIPPAAATINVVKNVINDNSGTKVVADFPLFVNATPVISGATTVFVPATYIVSETSDVGYVQTFSGDCDMSGYVTIAPGDNKFCIITNDDILPVIVAPVIIPPSGGGHGSSAVVAPLIDVVKVPNPLALPKGSGSVTYTYTLRNIGSVPMTDITMIGDSCAPLVLVSGDTNADDILAVDETWVYTCTAMLTKTTTNTVVATGWASGVSAVDIASATVVVGAPVVPPLIHVTNVPNPLALPATGGLVTYTETVTNPGVTALASVALVDDKCAPVQYVSGDMNNDSKLDTTETWVYTCQTMLNKTTTNTVVATGTANSISVRDFAIATVVVSVPGFPNTGLSRGGGRTVFLLLGVLVGVIVIRFFVKRKKQPNI